MRIYKAGLQDSAITPHTKDSNFCALSYGTTVYLIHHITCDHGFFNETEAFLLQRLLSEVRRRPSQRVLPARCSNRSHPQESLAICGNECESTNLGVEASLLVARQRAFLIDSDDFSVQNDASKKAQPVNQEISRHKFSDRSCQGAIPTDFVNGSSAGALRKVKGSFGIRTCQGLIQTVMPAKKQAKTDVHDIHITMMPALEARNAFWNKRFTGLKHGSLRANYKHSLPRESLKDLHTTKEMGKKLYGGSICALLWIQIGSWIIIDGYRPRGSGTIGETKMSDINSSHSFITNENVQAGAGQLSERGTLQNIAEKVVLALNQLLALIRREYIQVLKHTTNEILMKLTPSQENLPSPSFQADLARDPSPTAFLAACAIFAFATAVFQNLRRQDRYQNHLLLSGILAAVLVSLLQNEDIRVQQHLQRFVPSAIVMVLPSSAMLHWLGRKLGYRLWREDEYDLKELPTTV